MSGAVHVADGGAVVRLALGVAGVGLGLVVALLVRNDRCDVGDLC